MTELLHYGVKRRSGRYPWGSGGDAYQRSKSFLAYLDDMKKEGLSEKEIADGCGMTIKSMREQKSIAVMERRSGDRAMVIRLSEKGVSNAEIGRRMNINESTVRSLKNSVLNDRAQIMRNTADVLKSRVDEVNYVDIGPGTEQQLGVKSTRLSSAVTMLVNEGYTKHYIPVEQLGTQGQKTTVTVLAKPGVGYREVYDNADKIRMVQRYSENEGRTFLNIETPREVSSKKVAVRYQEQGGADKDGVIELRRGVPELSLGNSKYAQVRISVDGTHYLKGMAVYSDDLPKGVDVLFNTNKYKSRTPNDLDAMKKMSDDPDNPFGSTIKQRHYVDSKGKKQLSAINIVAEEGNWDEWSRTIASQVLAKQPLPLVKQQLDLQAKTYKQQYDEIMSLTNNTIKQHQLQALADSCDAASINLKAAAMPRQAYHVILPITKMRENEIYAPNYKNGEKVVLIRYPHGGTFEIPELTVNNKNSSAKSILGRAKDAVGINPKVAMQLSGADFDGDTVLVIPNNRKQIKTSPHLAGLKDFDPKEAYPGYEGMVPVSSKRKNQEMGDITNLITDMQLKGASSDEVCRAVKHSMVVIDSEKHNLNRKQSYVDHGIAQLKEKYQGGANKGSSTLISKAKSPVRVNTRKAPKIDPETGKLIYEYTNETYTDPKTGQTKFRTTTSKALAETDDAFTLSSGTTVEKYYAEYSNSMKALANQSRKAMVDTPNLKYSPQAKKTYASEVESLDSKLNIALRNAPLERQAQILGNKVVQAKRDSNPDLSGEDIKKIKGQAISAARYRVGASKQRIEITDKEWEAIQAGAISHNKLQAILANTDQDALAKRATPKPTHTLSSSQKQLAAARLASGYTQQEVAESLGIPVALIKDML